MNTHPVCVIVDAYSTAKDYPLLFAQRGWQCVHVQGTPDLLPVFAPSFCPERYLVNIVHQGDVEQTLAAVRSYQPTLVIAGIEPGVLLADVLSERLGLLTNGTGHSLARRDKFAMAQSLTRIGIAAAAQYKSNDGQQIVAWSCDHGRWPVVVKPIHSAGTDGVTICSSPQEVGQACAAILGQRNIVGLINDEVMVQDFLRGTEYVVNTVSRDGRHFVNDIWQSTKRRLSGASYIYDREELLPVDGPAQSQLVPYVLRVLDALGIQHGPAHSEVILTADGPVLIETGARIAGAMNQQAIASCVGHSQLELTVLAYADPTEFLLATKHPYTLQQHMFNVDLISERAGIVREIPMLPSLRALPTLFDLSLKVRPGSLIRQTVDLHSSPGLLTLVGAKREHLMSDYLQIRALEKDGFVIDPAPVL